MAGEFRNTFSGNFGREQYCFALWKRRPYCSDFFVQQSASVYSIRHWRHRDFGRKKYRKKTNFKKINRSNQ